MRATEFIKTCIAKAAEYYANPSTTATFIMITGAIGWATSSLCQTVAISTNKTIPAKEKKFLIPQELSDGAINITIFLTLTTFFKNIGKYIVDKGIFLPKNIKECPETLKKIFDIPDKLREFPGVIKNITEVKNISPDNPNLLKILDLPKKLHKNQAITNKVKELVNLHQSNPAYFEGLVQKLDDYASYRSGMSVLTGLLGSMIAVNVFTPIVRNKIAAFVQKKKIQKTDISNNQIIVSPYTNLQNNKPSYKDISSYLYATRNSLNKISFY